jgi:prepilin-type N-terminal cleavage/methylation domain-containing protein
MMRNRSGLTIFEVLVVLGILGIVSAFVVPNVMNWRRGVQLRGAANNLKGDLEMAKINAIRENNYVAVMFRDTLRYEIFVDNGAGDDGVADNWIRDGEERLLRAREMPTGITIDFDATSFGFLGKKTRFTGRGHCTAGSTFLQNEKNDRIRVILNRLGQITLEKQ